MERIRKKRTGFTIVELLTVMGVIAILIGLLVPALTLVQDYAKEIQQRAQFHGIEVGIGMYETEFGSYPESNDNDEEYDVSKDHPDDAVYYGGSQKLAEAMVGLDMIGFHPKSDFRSDGENWRDDGDGDVEEVLVYNAVTGIADNEAGLLGETAEENILVRQGPYIDLEYANAFTLDNVYDTTALGSFPQAYPPTPGQYSIVLCDEYAAKRQSAKKIGMPILYYRARTIFTQQISTVANDPDGLAIVNDIYYYPDNQNILDLGTPEDGTDHPLCENSGDLTDWLSFEKMILNTQVTQIQRPYRADSYILMSAGKDGLYGSPDDIFNFRKE